MLAELPEELREYRGNPKDKKARLAFEKKQVNTFMRRCCAIFSRTLPACHLCLPPTAA